MGSKSNYLENKILDHVLGGVTYTPPATLYVALFTAAPGETGGGTEVSGGGYARVAVANDTTNWPAASNGQKSNGTVITFPAATANWGTVVAWGIFDAATGGNLLYYGDVSPNRTVNNGDTAQFAVGALTFTED
jgi:hypothetical protein